MIDDRGDGHHGDTVAVTVAARDTVDPEVVMEEPGTRGHHRMSGWPPAGAAVHLPARSPPWTSCGVHVILWTGTG